MKFSIMLWGDTTQASHKNKYNLLQNVAKYADENDFTAIWTPERHFHPFGGQYPNAATTAAALAMCTHKIKIRAGSVVVPLHHPLRLAEEWSFVDNLSGGRVEVSLAAGWNENDYVLAPEKYENRHSHMWEGMEILRSLWKGEPYVGLNGKGKETSVNIYPSPIQREIPLWITSSGNIRTYATAGEKGCDVLTHLLGQDLDTLSQKLEQFRAHRIKSGHNPNNARVALMLHTLLGSDIDTVRETAREPFTNYLKQSAHLSLSEEERNDWNDSPELQNEMSSIAFKRYFGTSSLMGTPESCEPLVEKISDMGVSEICCLVDFGLEEQIVMEGLKYLTKLKNMTRDV